MSYRILYAEDEPFLSRIVRDNLIAQGYEVTCVFDGNEALKNYKERNFDLCLVDIMMPASDGYNLVKYIRETDKTIPVIFLTARSMDDDIVKAFKSGGNDYLRKPFSMAELNVRIEALLSRFSNSVSVATDNSWQQFAGCRLDPINQSLITPAESFDLSYKETRLLEMLLRKRNEVLERQTALMEIWGDDNIYNANSMNVFIAHLRKRLNACTGVQIMGIRGVGYKLLC